MDQLFLQTVLVVTLTMIVVGAIRIVFGFENIMYFLLRFVPYRAKPAPLNQALVDAATEEGRALATWITTTNPALWELESDHCHYHGIPAVSFVHPSAYGRQAGIFAGARDRDMRTENRITGDTNDQRLLWEAARRFYTAREERRVARIHAKRDRALARAKRIVTRIKDKAA